MKKGFILVTILIVFITSIYGQLSIADSAYENSRTLEYIEIPEGVTRIGRWAFRDCINLKYVKLPSTLSSIGFGAFAGTAISEITIPENVTTIESSAFAACRNLTKINIPAGVSNIDTLMFLFCNDLSEINVHDSNNMYSSIDGILYNKSRTELIYYPKGRSGDCNISEIVNKINQDGLRACEKLLNINVNISNRNYSSINGVLFDKTIATLIIYPAGKKGNYTVPNSVQDIESWAFYRCRQLTGVTISNRVSIIKTHTFTECTELVNIYIPNSVTLIERGAFEFCIKINQNLRQMIIEKYGRQCFEETLG
jgi:hypothetical protein